MNLHRLALVFLLLFTAAFASAQTGSITGKVTDDEGIPLPGATIEIVGTQLKATADQEGVYTLADVPAGEHTVRAMTYSYRSVTAQVTVTAGQTASQDFALQVDLLALEEIVVTGTVTPERKIESSTAITTLSSEEIIESAPQSATEYLRRVPGFTRVESSGGEVNQNLSVRGLFGVESVNFTEDGMQVYPTMHIFFMNADNLIRFDENIETIEVLRGGTSPIFGSTTTGATVNFINRTGGDEIHGAVKGTVASRGLARFDFNTNGPITDQWRFNFGGFYRYDDEIRDSDYPSIKGGQLKANVSRALENGFIKLSLKYLDDKNLFILPLPFANPDDPEFVPGFSDTGGYHSKEGVNIRVPLPRGNDDLEFPLDDGIKTKGNWVQGQVSFDLGDDWYFDDIAQIMSVDHQWNAMVPAAPTDADEYVQGIVNGLISNGTVAPGSVGQLLYTNFGRDPETGAKTPYSTANGLVNPGQEFHVEKPISSFSNKIIFRKDTGSNNFGIGSYFAYYTQDNRWFFTSILTDIQDNPRFLDLVVTQPDGSIHEVTQNGFRQFLNTYVNGRGNNTLFAIFGSDEVKIGDRFRLDLAIRYERQNYFSVAENSSTFDLDEDPDTTYDRVVYGNGVHRQFEFDIDDVAYSIGANYQIHPDTLALYGAFTRGFRLPALDDFLFEQRQELIELIEPTSSHVWEAGVKYAGTQIAFTGTFFYAQVFDVVGRGVEFDPVTGNPIFVTRPQPDSDAWGFELETVTRPVGDLELRASATLIEVEAPAGAQAQIRFDGFTPAAIDFEAVYRVGEDGRLLFDIHYVGERTNTERTVFLNDYAYINLGGGYDLGDSGIKLTGRILNLNNSQGFEEGDPRVDPTRGAAQFLFNARPLLPRRYTLEARYDW
ncbi:TonB-dependent receptor [bacterium]|nr:TonB-dependent receptor [bacterium]MCI0613236.1 TonB-dependent receptor [bacterium]